MSAALRHKYIGLKVGDKEECFIHMLLWTPIDSAIRHLHREVCSTATSVHTFQKLLIYLFIYYLYTLMEIRQVTRGAHPCGHVY